MILTLLYAFARQVKAQRRVVEGIACIGVTARDE